MPFSLASRLKHHGLSPSKLKSLGPGAPRLDRLIRSALAIAVSLSMTGCLPTLTPTPVPNPTVGQRPEDVKYYPSDEPVRLGIQRFYEGNYGLAQHYFQDAVEKAPKDATAWVGLAASYDRLGNSISPIAPTHRRPGSSAPRRPFSITRATLTCCAATSDMRVASSRRRCG